MTDASLSIENLSAGYGGKKVLNDVTFTAPPGALLCLVGPSGCGKSTLLRIIAGLDAPYSGTVRIGDDVLTGDGVFLRPQERRVGLVFQHPSLFPHMTVKENIAFGLNKVSAGARAAKTAEMLALTGLDALASRYPHQLSGGQQQRAALARSLAPEPRAMLLDEPFANLDHTLRRDIREDVAALLKNAGVPAVMVTHDPEEALIMADRMVLLDEHGAVRQAGTPEELHNNPVDIASAAFFGVINVIEAKREGDMIVSHVGAVPARDYAPHLPDGAPAVLVTRPEGLRIEAPEASACVNAAVTGARHTGAGWLVSAALDTGEQVRFHHIYGECPAPGARVCIGVEPPHLFVFAR